MDEQKRIDGELEAVAKEAYNIGGHSAANVALQAASLLAVKPIQAARRRTSRFSLGVASI